MFTLTATEKTAAKSIALKQAINKTLARHQDEYGYGTISKVIPGWKFELFFTPHSNQPITFQAVNDNNGVYDFDLDANKLEQGWIVINGSNATASILLSEWFNELIA